MKRDLLRKKLTVLLLMVFVFFNVHNTYSFSFDTDSVSRSVLTYCKEKYFKVGLKVFGGSETYYIDKTGKKLNIPTEKYLGYGEFSEGLAPVIIKNNDNKLKYGYMDISGKTVIEPQYDLTYGFSEGFATVGINGYYTSSENSNERIYGMRFGLIDKTGNMIVQPQYRFIGAFKNGQAIASTENGHVFIDKNLNTLSIKNEDMFFEPKKDYSWKSKRITVGFIRKFQLDGYALCDKNGKQLTGHIFYSKGYFSDGLASVMTEDGRGYINKKGEFVIGPDLNWAQLGHFSDGIALVKRASRFYQKYFTDSIFKKVFKEYNNSTN